MLKVHKYKILAQKLDLPLRIKVEKSKFKSK